jgi:hypothetical protein
MDRAPRILVVGSAAADQVPGQIAPSPRARQVCQRPRVIVRVDAVRRAPNGKPDYKWARKVVLDSQEGVGSPR